MLFPNQTVIPLGVSSSWFFCWCSWCRECRRKLYSTGLCGFSHRQSFSAILQLGHCLSRSFCDRVVASAVWILLSLLSCVTFSNCCRHSQWKHQCLHQFESCCWARFQVFPFCAWSGQFLSLMPGMTLATP